MRKQALVIILLLLLLVIPAQAQEPDERPFIGYAPSRWNPGDDPLPVLIVLHGAGGDGQSMAVFTNMHEVAETEGFVVIYPDGIDREWNDGFNFRPHVEVDDIAFIRTIIDSTADRIDIDRERIYIAGFSNGGSMAYEIACNAPDLIAGIAVVSGMMGLHQIPDCAPDHPLPIIIIHGTEDTVIRFNRGMRDVDTAETITYLQPVLWTSGLHTMAAHRHDVSSCCRTLTRLTIHGCASHSMKTAPITPMSRFMKSSAADTHGPDSLANLFQRAQSAMTFPPTKPSGHFSWAHYPTIHSCIQHC